MEKLYNISNEDDCLKKQNLMFAFISIVKLLQTFFK